MPELKCMLQLMLLCEYMDELKGYYWSDDYEEKAKTKTFKQLLDERAVAGTEVHFDTDK